jgi:hypothetical protein
MVDIVPKTFYNKFISYLTHFLRPDGIIEIHDILHDIIHIAMRSCMISQKQL